LCWTAHDGVAAMTLHAQNITLQRGQRILVENVDLTLSAGQGLVLRGPNGSGKTTLLRALAGLHQPRAGKINGQVLEDGPPQISFLGHQDPIKPSEKLVDQLTFWARVAGGQVTAIGDIADQVGLTRQLQLQGGVLSAGQRRRASLARLILEARPIWLLDEPAAPLDAAGRILLGAVLDNHRSHGGSFAAAVHDDLPGLACETIWLGQS
jgi:heme exporter protein A